MNVADLFLAIRTGDVERVTATLVAASDKERRAAAKEIDEQSRQWRWDHREHHARRLAATVAWAGTATARQIVSQSWSFTRNQDALYDVLVARGPGFMANLARMLLRDDRPFGWRLIRRAVREGVIARPDEPSYLAGMVLSRAGESWPRGTDAVARNLLADPELLGEVWRLFEQDVGGALNVWRDEDDPWSRGLRTLAAEGHLDRVRLLDASLDALMRDFRESGVGWYARMHEALEPTESERLERMDQYVALATGPSPTGLKEALEAFKALGDACPADALATAAPVALTQPQKAPALTMLRLAEAAARREVAARPVLLAAVAAGLGHERTDVQERALKLIERYPDDAPRVELLAYVDVSAAPLRARVAALTGVVAEPETIEAPALAELNGEAAVLVREGRWPEPRIPTPRPGEPLQPVESVEELIELASMLLEGQGSGDDAERLLDGVSRLCDQRPRNFERRTEGLVTQAHAPWKAFPVPFDGRQMISMVVLGWVRGRNPSTFDARSIEGLLATRALELGRRAARRIARPLLAFPTHEGGWLDPAVLEQREAAAGRIRNRPDPGDRSAAHFRARLGPGFVLVPEVVDEHEWSWYRRTPRLGVYVESIPPELAYAEGYITDALHRLGHTSGRWMSFDHLWAAQDALGARWQCTVLPAYPEVQFARALTAIADCIDSGAAHHPEPVLEHMLGREVPLRDPAWTVVGAALVAKAPELRRLAADVVVATVLNGRFDATRLGSGLAWLLGAGLGSITRIDAPLRDAARVSPLHAAQIVRVLEVLVAGLPQDQKNLHAPLALAFELAAESRSGPIEPLARGALERIGSAASRSSKLGKSARGLLELERDGVSYDAILRLAAAASS